MKVEYVPLGQIYPDPEQPRKRFNQNALEKLQRSIQQQGILNPLHVEKTKDGYKLEDGERRYRAATALGLKEVPVIVLSEADSMERLVRQFHLQEEREGWTSIERASVVDRIAQEHNMDIDAIGKILGLEKRTIQDYRNLLKLINRELVKDLDLSLSSAARVATTMARFKNLYKKQTGHQLPSDLVEKIEESLVRAVAQDIIVRDQLMTFCEFVGQEAEAIEEVAKGPDAIKRMLKEMETPSGQLWFRGRTYKRRIRDFIGQTKLAINSGALQDLRNDEKVMAEIEEVRNLLARV